VRNATEEMRRELMRKPVELNVDAVKAASAGRSHEVMGSGGPHPLTADEVKEAAKGKSEEVVKNHLAKRTRP
jgi:hypothetical protein